MRYQRVFAANFPVMARIDTIVETGTDGLALPTGSAILDAMLEDLAVGVPWKKSRTRGDLIPAVEKAVIELFEARDQGAFTVRGGG